jgi:hypothetical protein
MVRWELLLLKKLRKYLGADGGCAKATYTTGSARPHTR